MEKKKTEKEKKSLPIGTSVMVFRDFRAADWLPDDDKNIRDRF